LSALIIYLAYYVHGGGLEKEVQRRFERFAEKDPVQDAREALAGEDFRLYTVGPFADWMAPGVGRPREYVQFYGARWIGPDDREGLTEDEIQARERALNYFAEYNRIVYEEGQNRLRRESTWPGES